MSFLDEDQATAGRISLGTRRAGLESLLPRRRRQTARQQQVSGYDILPSTMQPIPGVVSTPTDIARVGVDVSQQLQQQGTTAAQVPNVFERYAETGAAPIGDFRQYLYPSPPTEEDEEEENDVIKATDEEFAENFGIDPYDPETPLGQFYLDQETAAEAAAGRLSALYSDLNLGGRTVLGLEVTALGKESEIVQQVFEQAREGNLTDTNGNKVSEADVWSHYAKGEQETAYPPVDLSADLTFGDDDDGGGGGGTSTPPSSQSFLGIDPGIDPSISDGGGGGGGGSAMGLGYSGSTADFGLD